MEIIISRSESYGQRAYVALVGEAGAEVWEQLLPLIARAAIGACTAEHARRERRSVRKSVRELAGRGRRGSVPEGLTTKTKSPRRRWEAATRSEVRPPAPALGWEAECEEARGRISDALGVAGANMAPLAAYPPPLALEKETETHCRVTWKAPPAAQALSLICSVDHVSLLFHTGVTTRHFSCLLR